MRLLHFHFKNQNTAVGPARYRGNSPVPRWRLWQSFRLPRAEWAPVYRRTQRELIPDRGMQTCRWRWFYCIIYPSSSRSSSSTEWRQRDVRADEYIDIHQQPGCVVVVVVACGELVVGPLDDPRQPPPPGRAAATAAQARRRDILGPASMPGKLRYGDQIKADHSVWQRVLRHVNWKSIKKETWKITRNSANADKPRSRLEVSKCHQTRYH